MGTLQYGIISQNAAILTEPSLVEKLKTGSLNMLVGLGTVFIILVLIIGFIFLLRFIPRIINKSSNKTIETSNTVDQVISQIIEQEEVNLCDDLELVAVITSAVYAYLGDAAPADGLIVRSIRKANSRRRMNA
jgi:Na+-transporting methylmalonyl-CoA/oxaloacetate decarboxylase gamma subunit